MPSSIDRHSPVPYYEQLFTILRDNITSGLPEVGQRLPSESEICRTYSLSRATVRQTLQKLESEGWARKIPRRGYFVASPSTTPAWVIEESAGFLESSLSYGQTGISTTVISSGYLTLPAHAAIALGVTPGEQGFGLERMRTLNGEPAMFSTNWSVGPVAKIVAQASDVLSGQESLTAAMSAAGWTVAGATRVLESMAAPESVAQPLGVRAGTALLRIRSTSWSASGQHFDYYETWVRTDIVPLEVHVSAAKA